MSTPGTSLQREAYLKEFTAPSHLHARPSHGDLKTRDGSCETMFQPRRVVRQECARRVRLVVHRKRRCPIIISHTSESSSQGRHLAERQGGGDPRIREGITSGTSRIAISRCDCLCRQIGIAEDMLME